MLAVPDYLRVLAVFHDVVEDCPLDMLTFVAAVDDEWTMVRLDHLTHKPGESREAYIDRVCLTPESVIVKCADLCDNILRIDGLNPDVAARLHKKYSRDCSQIADWYERRPVTARLESQLAYAVANVETVLTQWHTFPRFPRPGSLLGSGR